MPKKINKGHPHQRTTIILLTCLLTLSILLLIFTNWNRLSFGYHLIVWKLFPNQSPQYLEKLLKEKILTEYQNTLTPSEWETLQKANRMLTVYFRSDATEEQIFQIVADLGKRKTVANIKYTSKQEAYEQFKAVNKDDPLLLEAISPDVLPESLDIELTDTQYRGELQTYLQSIPQVEDVRVPASFEDALKDLHPTP